LFATRTGVILMLKSAPMGVPLAGTLGGWLGGVGMGGTW
jgi:hypothetical protein